MADLEERVIISVDLDVNLLTQSAEEAIAAIKKIKDEQKLLEEAGQQATVQYRQNAQALSLYNKQLNDAAKALAINDQQTKNSTGSLQDLRQQLIAATLQFKLYSDEQKKNLPAAIALGAEIKSLSDNIKAQELALGNASRNVGNYTEAIDPLKSQVIGLRQEHRQLTTTMQGALGVFALLNIAGGEGAEVSKAQKAALAGLVAMQAISQIRMGALAAQQLVSKAATVALTTATVAQTTATGALATLQTFLQVQLGLTAVAARGLAIALAATGIGLVILAIIALTSYAASAATATDKLASSTGNLTKEFTDHEVELAKLSIEYRKLTGEIDDTQASIETLSVDHEKALNKINIDAQEKLATANTFWKKFTEGLLSLRTYDKYIADQRAIIQREADLKAIKALEEYNAKVANITTAAWAKEQEENKKRDEKAAKDALERAKKAAEDLARELERQRLLRLEQDRLLSLAGTEAEIDAWKHRNDALEALYDTDVENFSAAIKKKADAWTKSLGQGLKDEDKNRKENLDAAAEYIQNLGQIGSSLLDYTTTINQNEIDALEDKHKRGIISEKTYNRQIAEMRRKQAIAEKEKAAFNVAITTAVAVISALASVPPNVALAALAGITGAIEEAIILKRKIPEAPTFEKGGAKQFGVFGGKSHAHGGTKGYFDDGTQVEVEKDEVWAVVNKNSAALMNLSKWNQMGGGIPFMERGGFFKFEDGGFAARVNSQAALNSNFDMSGVVNAIADMNIFVRVSEINAVQNRVAVTENNRNV